MVGGICNLVMKERTNIVKWVISQWVINAGMYQLWILGWDKVR